MVIKGFTMKLCQGMEEEYERRHNNIWTEMKEMINTVEGITLFFWIKIH